MEPIRQDLKPFRVGRGEVKTLLVFLYIPSSKWRLRPSTDDYLDPFSLDTHHGRKRKKLKSRTNPKVIPSGFAWKCQNLKVSGDSEVHSCG